MELAGSTYEVLIREEEKAEEEKKEQREPCRGRRRAEGGDTNWGVGGGGSRGILASLSVWIEETPARAPSDVRSVCVCVKNLDVNSRGGLEEMRSLTRKGEKSCARGCVCVLSGGLFFR